MGTTTNGMGLFTASSPSALALRYDQLMGSNTLNPKALRLFGMMAVENGYADGMKIVQAVEENRVHENSNEIIEILGKIHPFVLKQIRENFANKATIQARLFDDTKNVIASVKRVVGSNEQVYDVNVYEENNTILIMSKIGKNQLDAIFEKLSTANGKHVVIQTMNELSSKDIEYALTVWQILVNNRTMFKSLKLGIGKGFTLEMNDASSSKIEMTVGEIEIEKLFHIIDVYRDNHADDLEIEVNITNEDLPFDILRWAYEFVYETKHIDKKTENRILVLAEKLKNKQALSGDEKEYIRMAVSHLKNVHVELLYHRKLIQWLLKYMGNITRTDIANDFTNTIHDVGKRALVQNHLRYFVSILVRGRYDNHINSAFNSLKTKPQISETLDNLYSDYNFSYYRLQFENSLPSSIVLKTRDSNVSLTYIVKNLITNAGRYVDESKPKEDRWIIMKADINEDGSLTISVSDNGIGISPENIAKLGTFGFRERRKEVNGSQGIGLSSVKRYLKRIGWSELKIQSEGEGKGTKFSFTIPKEDLRISE